MITIQKGNVFRIIPESKLEEWKSKGFVAMDAPDGSSEPAEADAAADESDDEPVPEGVQFEDSREDEKLISEKGIYFSQLSTIAELRHACGELGIDFKMTDSKAALTEKVKAYIDAVKENRRS